MCRRVDHASRDVRQTLCDFAIVPVFCPTCQTTRDVVVVSPDLRKLIGDVSNISRQR